MFLVAWSSLVWVLVSWGALIALATPVTVILYWWDKRAAKLQRRRVPERTLHLWALAGGWPGALWARPQLRHKTQKQPFSAILWGTVVLNLVAGLAAIYWSAR